MADVGKLAVQLSANPAEFTAGMQRAMEAAAQFTNQVQSKFGSLGGAVLQLNSAVGGLNIGPTLQKAAQYARQAGMMIASAFSGDYLGALIMGGTMAVQAAIGFVHMGESIAASAIATMTAVSAQAKLGRQLGISAEAAQTLSLAAGVAGIAQEDFSHGMMVFVRRMGELRQEVRGSGGSISEALQRMGIDAQRFANMDAGAQMVELARGLQSVGNAADRARLLHDVLSRAGEAMAPFLMRGPEFVANIQRMAVMMGAIASNEDAARFQGIMRSFREIQALSDLFSRGVGIQLARGLAPAFEAFERFKTAAIRDFVEMGGAGMGESIYNTASIAADGISKLFEIIDALRPVTRSSNAFFTQWVHTIWEVYQAVSPLASAWLELVGAFLGGGQSVQNTADLIDRLTAYLRDFEGQARLAAVTIKNDWLPAIADGLMGLAAWADAMAAMPLMPRAAVDALSSFASSAINAAAGVREIARQMNQARAVTSEYRIELERLQGSVGAVEAGSIEAVSAILAAQQAQHALAAGAGSVIRASSMSFEGPPEPPPGMPAGPVLGELSNPPMPGGGSAAPAMQGVVGTGGGEVQTDAPAAIENQTHALVRALEVLGAEIAGINTLRRLGVLSL